jgi:hypothetical protein
MISAKAIGTRRFHIALIPWLTIAPPSAVRTRPCVCRPPGDRLLDYGLGKRELLSAQFRDRALRLFLATALAQVSPTYRPPDPVG